MPNNTGKGEIIGDQLCNAGLVVWLDFCNITQDFALTIEVIFSVHDLFDFS